MGFPREERMKMNLGRRAHAGAEPASVASDLRLSAEAEGFLVEEWLEDPEMGLSGAPDIVILLTGNRAVVVDLKLTRLHRATFARKVQLYAYCHLVERSTRRTCTSAYLRFIGGGWVEVPYGSRADAIVSMYVGKARMVLRGYVPPRIEGRRCGYCEMRRFCRDCPPSGPRTPSCRTRSGSGRSSGARTGRCCSGRTPPPRPPPRPRRVPRAGRAGRGISRATPGRRGTCSQVEIGLM
ncbi:MAG: CRISPR-associated protein Cas4 [Conexivisphaera sp.]